MAVLDARSSKFKIGSTLYENIMSIEITGDDKQQLSFTDLQNGATKEFTLTVNAKVDIAAGGIWRAAYDAAVGSTTLTMTWMPYGNTTASAGQPHIQMTGAYVDGKPGLTIEADAKNKATTDIVFVVDDYTLVSA